MKSKCRVEDEFAFQMRGLNLAKGYWIRFCSGLLFSCFGWMEKSQRQFTQIHLHQRGNHGQMKYVPIA